MSFEVMNNTTSWNHFESLLVGKLEADCQSRWTLDSDGAADSNFFWMVMITPTFASRWRTHLQDTLENAIRHPTTVHKSSIPQHKRNS